MKISNIRSGLLTFVGVAVLTLTGLAQDRIAQAKYEIIRETINFLATDSVVSSDTNFRITCEPLDYGCFDSQLSNNPITGIKQWYDRWRAVSATNEAGLSNLRDRIMADIVERSGKGYRKQLSGYASYIARLEQLVEPLENSTSAPEAIAATATNSDTLHELTHNGMSDGEAIYPAQATEDSANNSEKENTMIAYFALGIGLLALIIALVPVLKKRETQLPLEFQQIPERLDELMMRMKRLERQTDNPQVKEAVTSLTEIMETIEKRVVALEDRSRHDAD